jgi:hypothetical protein
MEVDSLFVLSNEFESIGLSESCLNIFISGIGLSKQDVLFDGLVEQHWLLSDIADLPSELSQVNFLDVSSVDEHLTFFGVVESLNQLD